MSKEIIAGSKGHGIRLHKALAECKTTGDYMRYNREIRGYSVEVLSELSGVSYASICAWEQGQRNPSLPPLILVCNALGLAIDEYVGRCVA